MGAKFASTDREAFRALNNAAQTCVTYHPDYSRIIIIDRERFDALIAPPSAPDSMS